MQSLLFAQVFGASYSLYNDLANRNWLGATFDALGIIGAAAQFLQACFAAGTPIRTPEGAVAIEHIKPGDVVLSRSEFDPVGPVEAKVVEEVFVRTAPVLDLRVGDRTVTTTGEHPFFAEGRGWVAANELEPGERVLGLSGEWLLVEEVSDNGQVTTVYNLRVQDYHTYFVGAREWGFSVWAHNASYAVIEALEEGQINRASRQRAGVLTEAELNPQHHLFPQARSDWFSQRGITVDDHTVTIDRTLHDALHAGGGPGLGGGWWNNEIMSRLNAAEAGLGNGERLSASEILAIRDGMVQDFKLTGIPILPYAR
jgi:hypothetical protein